MAGSRRYAIVLPLLVASLVMSCVDDEGGRSDNEESGPVRRNVVIFVADDQPVGTLEIMNETRRWFGERGTSFPNTFATTPVCCPARASIMTGHYAHNHGVVTNDDVREMDPSETLQAILQRAGYHTAIFGKYLNRWRGDPPFFDHWETFGGRHDYEGGRWNVNGEARETTGYRPTYLRERIAAHLQRLEGEDDTPWFLFVALEAPHARYVVEPKYRDHPVSQWRSNPAVFEQDRNDKPAFVREAPLAPDEARSVRRRQLQTLLSTDDLVSRVSTLLGDLDEEADTLAVYVSDNGYTWGEHGLLGTARGKGTPYSRSIQVPLLVRWPQGVDAPRVDPRWSRNIDIAPTVLQMTSAANPSAMDGRSLLEAREREEVFTEHWRRRTPARSSTPNWRSLRTPSYQYTEYRRGGRTMFREYYDLTKDPWQLTNLFGDDRESNDPDVRGLHERLLRYARCRGEACP